MYVCIYAYVLANNRVLTEVDVENRHWGGGNAGANRYMYNT